jgi:hypothetical protein
MESATTTTVSIPLILADLFTFPRFQFDFLFQEIVKYTNYTLSVKWKMTSPKYELNKFTPGDVLALRPGGRNRRERAVRRTAERPLRRGE